MLKKFFEYVRCGFAGLKPPRDEIGDRMRQVDEYRADLARRGMVERPPNAESQPRVSGWIARDGSRRRQQLIKEAIMVGHKPPYRATYR